MKKISICTPFYKKHEVTDFTFNYYKNLKEELKNKIEIILIAVGSEGEKSKKIAENNEYHYIEYPNSPLSQKSNQLYLKSKEFNVDACLKIDSDSILLKDVFYLYNDLISQNVDYFGFLDEYYIMKKNVYHWLGYNENNGPNRIGEPCGVGRFLSNDLLNKLDWKPFGDYEKDSGMDGILTKRIKLLDLKKRFSFSNKKVFQLKTDTQITNNRLLLINSVKENIDVPINIEKINKYLANL
ncbi:MAG: hypothetical protein ACOC3V_01385 [bacterium]